MSDLAGKTVAGYPIDKLIAKGAYADVWQVTTSESPLAVKIVHAQLQNDAALSAEIAKGWEAGRAAAHENLVIPYGAGVDAQLGAYCLQELIRGKSLRQIVMDGSRFAWRDVLITAEQLISGLAALHAAGVQHGDIWSGSILITQDQDVKLESPGGLMHVTRRIGEVISGQALSYQAPEILAGSPVSNESDIYSVGATIFALIAAQDPYPPESADRLLQIVMERKLARATALRDDLPPEADELMNRMMSHDPQQRYGSAVDLLADVGRLRNNKALAPLKGGKPAGPERPLRAASAAALPPAMRSGPRPAVGSRSNAGMKPPSGVGSAVKPPTGFGAAVGHMRGKSGLGAAVASSGSGLRSIKEGATKHIFGRLDTHVKSTIPQSDAEKRGDDLYRQGQLPLALNCWRDAYDTDPHTALKVKVELGERDLGREAFNNALEEAKLRLSDGNFSGAIARVQEALVCAEDEPQRQECLKIEREAGERLVEERASNRKKMIIGGAVIAGVVVLLLLFLMRGGSAPKEPETETATATAVAPKPAPAPAPGPSKPTPGVPSSEPQNYTTVNGEVTVTYRAPWVVQGVRLIAVSAGNEQSATFGAGKLPDTAQLEDVIQAIRSGSGKLLTQSAVLESADFKAQGKYAVSKTGVRYVGKDTKNWLHYWFVVESPTKALCLAEFDGREDLFTQDMREEMMNIMRSWQYTKP